MIIHNAADAWNAGPDYAFGWGLVDGAASANFLSRTVTPLAGEIHQLFAATYAGAQQTYVVDISQGGPLKVTLVWTDPAGATQGGLDNRTSVLVNDLDLTITGPGGTYLPWTLDVNNPQNPAVRTQRNAVDNEEQVLIDLPESGSYTIRINHTGQMQEDLQNYSLLVSGTHWDPDRFEPNDTTGTATILGSLDAITLRKSDDPQRR